MIERGLRSLLWALERPLMVAAEPAAHRDVILVLGAPLTVHGTLSRVLHERVATAAMLWHRYSAAAVIVSGGVTQPGLPSEAAMMADGLVLAGVPRANILLEQQAQTTRENARFAATIMTAQGWRSAWIVTQPFHSRRAVRLCRAAGIDAHGWIMQQSMQYTQPLLGLRWTAREYAAWGVMLWQQNWAPLRAYARSLHFWAPLRGYARSLHFWAPLRGYARSLHFWAPLRGYARSLHFWAQPTEQR